MIFRLRRLTPGYFRLLQAVRADPTVAPNIHEEEESLQTYGKIKMQLASGSVSEPEDRMVNHLALILAIMGLSLSYYSVRQLSEEIKPPPEPLGPATKQE